LIKIGITGQKGFIGGHLTNTLKLEPSKYNLIPFKKSFFNSSGKMENFVSQCDVIVHLAAMNRHSDTTVIYETNIFLVKKLILALKNTSSNLHVIFASSIQEGLSNKYGESKREGGDLLAKWAENNNGVYTKLMIANVFGPFGKLFYNSVVATFCHQLTHKEQPNIEIDSEMKLIYVGELVEYFIKSIDTKQSSSTVKKIRTVRVPYSKQIKVSELLEMLIEFKIEYFEKGIFPNLSNTFTKNLFNTFVCYIDHSKCFPFYLEKHTDDRGSFVEIVKLNSGGQVSFSTTVPGITRGNHYHTRKVERFAVIKGEAMIELRRIGTSEIFKFELNGDSPSFVDMPIWYTHNITNIGQDELYTIFWINEEYNQYDPDTFFEEV
jgi:UDP-2-acetamido-2,6-beta-L-arabino-hexul-4-ose reductase